MESSLACVRRAFQTVYIYVTVLPPEICALVLFFFFRCLLFFRPSATVKEEIYILE